jgi:aryl sulfotransferase
MSLLVFGAEPLPAPLMTISPWIDCRFYGIPIEEMLAAVEAQEEHRPRFLKTHLPLDALPYFPEVRYLFVCRDTRDQFMSLWNHYSAYSDGFYARIEQTAPEYPFPRPPGDVREFWRDNMTKASFPWEEDGWPFWSHHYHAASWWAFRHLPNILCVHYNDLLADLEGQMRRIATFTGVEVAGEAWPELVRQATFEAMKEQGGELLPNLEMGFKGGSQAFLYRGTNGRWRGVLTEDDLGLYEAAVGRLDPALRRWMESGWLGLEGKEEGSQD